MPITALTIENFKGIKEPVRVELKPITMLFGPNSAGKSTIVQALHFAREIFECGNLNPDRTIAGGDSIDLGGFMNLVHKKDYFNKSIRLHFDFAFDSNSADSFPYLANGLGIETDESEHFLGFCWDKIETGLNPWLEITVQWSSLLDTPFISSYKTGFGERLFSEITSGDDGKRLSLNYLDIQSSVFINEDGDNFAIPYLEPAIMDESKNILHLNIMGKSAIPSPPTVHFPDLYEWHSEGIPEIPIFRKLDTFKSLLSSILLSPVEYLRKQLQQFRYIGPLRKVPDRNYAPSLTKSQSSWSDGLGAWDVLKNSESSFITEVNDWLLNRLGTGYGIKLKQYKEVDISSPLSLAILHNHYGDEESDLQQHFNSLPIKSRLLLHEAARDIEVAPADIGVGISQVLPVVVLALAFQQGILAIEQPELHIHPALQVALGDLFIEEIKGDNNINDGKIFLLETHSEHLLLRMLKRIREANDPDLADTSLGNGKFSPNDLSVYYVQTKDDVMRLTKLDVDEDGDFKEDWPEGFFEEREEELFY